MKIIFTSGPYLKKIVILGLIIVIVFGAGYFTGKFTLETFPASSFLAKEMPIFYIQKRATEACLTFDISWGEKTLPLVLQILAENQVPATFFVSGPWALTHSRELKAIANSGHEIASHGDKHINLSQYSKETVKDNIKKAHQDLLSIVDRVAPFFRPPNGDYDDVVIDTARELGFETVIWAVDSLDWKNPGPEYMVSRILTRTFPGAIILCHASDSSKQIHLALPGIIQGLRAKGYKLVSLSKLFENGTPAKNDPR
jgi:polysaccharide deacetylase family sporulation protein PdaB